MRIAGAYFSYGQIGGFRIGICRLCLVHNQLQTIDGKNTASVPQILQFKEIMITVTCPAHIELDKNEYYAFSTSSAAA